MSIHRVRGRQLLENFDFKALFIDEIGCASVHDAAPKPIGDTGCVYRFIAELGPIRMMEVFLAEPDGMIPDRNLRRRVHTQVEKNSYHNLLIFLDGDEERNQSLLYWVNQSDQKKRATEHTYLRGQPGDLFLSKLDGLVVKLSDLLPTGDLPHSLALRKAATLDIQAITKKFFSAFSQLRLDFIKWIDGIADDSERGWYASVLLNRLMFIYFLQKKAFIGGDAAYLDNKLRESGERGKDLFYSEFLDALFFEGFAKPERDRTPNARQLLGSGIPYLNGGLFIRHRLELEHSAIRIPDAAFAEVLALFGKYSWYLDDAPGANDNEINPDVLGYIFEKYINQKAFGAYYTRQEITDYLCQRSIHPVILAEVNKHSQRQFSDMGDLLMKLDADLCRILLFTVLPKLSILDPACGSGAFLVAAMTNLLQIYGAVFGRIQVLNDNNLSSYLAKILRQHPSLNYYIRKRIISDNLYGVDIMEEAAEIAKLRLFLALVGAAQSADQLEPLPNIDFNIMSGNSLIGLLTVDESRFDARRQQDFLQRENVKTYRRALAEKNRLVGVYRQTSAIDDLTALRQNIDAMKAAHQGPLNAILLDDFQALKIQYEQARLKGRPVKRPLTTDDIEDLKPFHWGYEFDEILETRGGFDVIITNPPWEVFQTDEKEFFHQFDPTIQKKKLKITEWKKRREALLQDPAIEKAWLDYVSGFPHVNRYFKLAPGFVNQRPGPDQKRLGNKPNLYMLFLEQCYNLLRNDGACGVVIPGGISNDAPTTQLRHLLFGSTRVTGLFGIENRNGVFEEVHRSFKFVVLTFIKARQTDYFPVAFMRLTAAELEGFPTQSDIRLSMPFVRQMSPSTLAVPEFKSTTDVEIAKRMQGLPRLGEDETGWQLELYGEELNMTRSSGLFRNYDTGYPVYVGGMIWHFDSYYATPQWWIEEQDVHKSFLQKRTKRIKGMQDVPIDMRNNHEVYRLAIRKIASATNERTLIASLLAPRHLAGNSLSVNFPFHHNQLRYNRLRMDYSDTLVLCSLLNSLTADYLLRTRVTTVLNQVYLMQLPIPRLMPGDLYFDQIVRNAARLICTAPEYDDLAAEIGLGDHHAGVKDPAERAQLRAELDGMAARIYGLSEAEFQHILSTFPLVDDGVKSAALKAFLELGD